jgi:hypothetical protein
MATTPTPPPTRRATRSPCAIAAFVVVALLALSGAYLLGRSTPLLALKLPQPTIDTIEIKPSPSVITAVRDLHRLESESFHMERVIETTDAQSKLFGLIEAKDAVLLVAVADVVAGVDLEGMKDADVTVDWPARRARLRLPPPEVFAATIDNTKTHVYQRSTDVLATRKEALEGMARQDAETSMKKAAIDGGILERARASAARSVEGLVRGLGFTDVTIEWQDP